MVLRRSDSSVALAVIAHVDNSSGRRKAGVSAALINFVDRWRKNRGLVFQLIGLLTYWPALKK
jgi:hypothetical protein